MAIEFCPFETDWGNVADWAAVLVGIVAAGVTIRVAIIANQTSKEAAAIAKDAKDIAKQQHDEGVQVRNGIARILGRLLVAEVLIAPEKLGAVLQGIDSILPQGPASAYNRATTEWVMSELHQTFLPTTEESLERLHNLPDALGNELAQLVGLCRGLVDSSRRIDGRFYRVDYNGHKLISSYQGDPKDFVALRKQAAEALRSSLYVAREFAAFAEVEVPSYTKVEGSLQIE